MKVEHAIVMITAVVILLGAVLQGRQLGAPGRDAYDRGLAYTYSGSHRQAVDAFSEALRETPRDIRVYIHRGTAYAALGDFTHAIQDFNEAERLAAQLPRTDVRLAELYAARATVYHEHGDGVSALADYRRVLAITPNVAMLNNQFAWLLATSPDPAVQNGKEALRYARKACDLTDWRDAAILDTLAAAYARAGDFKQAVHWQQKAAQLAGDDLRAELQSRIALYESKKAYVDHPTTGQ